MKTLDDQICRCKLSYQTRIALNTYPVLAAIQTILDYFEAIQKEEMRLTDLLVAFIDPNAEIDPNPVQSGSAAKKKEDGEEDDAEEEEEEEKPVDTGPDMDEAIETLVPTPVA